MSIKDLFEVDSVVSNSHKVEQSLPSMPISTGTNGSIDMGDNSGNNNPIKQPVSSATAARNVKEFMVHASCRSTVLTMWSPTLPGGHSHFPLIIGPDIDQITGYDPMVIEFLAHR